MNITRRGLLASAAAVAAAPSWRVVLRDRAAALGGPGLLRSYDVRAGATDFDRAHANCAYVYDNAVAGLALLAAGEVALAARLGEALVQAQARDRFWHDGRLRNAYAAGPAPQSGPYPLPGWWDGRWLEDAYQAGTGTGPLAWAMLLWLALDGRAPGAWRAAADRAAGFIETSLRAPSGFYGGFLGFEPAPARLDWVSTEQNLDCAVAFATLGRPAAAAHARGFVEARWDAGERRFYSGVRPDGSANPHSALDANLWPLLVGWTRPGWLGALDWVVREQGVPAADPSGVSFSTADRRGAWLEGTAIAALVLRGAGRGALASRMMRTVEENVSAAGLVFACTSEVLGTGLSTGLDSKAAEFVYYRRGCVSATGWGVLAERAGNPFA